jgi:hypothetical protein
MKTNFLANFQMEAGAFSSKGAATSNQRRSYRRAIKAGYSQTQAV